MTKKKRVPTDEQLVAVRSSAPLLIVKAFAGCGKTSMLEDFAGARKRARILYLAYNKSMEMAARGRFPANVTCMTTHSLAFRQFGRPYEAAGKLGNVRSSDVMMAFKTDPMTAKQALECVNNFIYSADKTLSDHHLPRASGTTLMGATMDTARKLWEAMKHIPDEGDDDTPFVCMPHDGYLKLFQLYRPNLASKFDIILLDEAQDTNPVTADIVLSQRCMRVLVGDAHQTIYGFRKSANALESAAMLPGAVVVHLTNSFRFGPDIAGIATALLTGLKGERYPLIGRGSQETLKLEVDRSKQYTHLCRTNASVFRAAAGFLGKTPFHLVGGANNYPLDRFLDIQNLASGNLGEVKDQFFRMMKSLPKLKAYAEAIKDKEILGLIGVQKEFGPRIPEIVEGIRAQVQENPDKAKVLLSTAHRSKGLEFNQVVLEPDFESFVDENGQLIMPAMQEDVEELNLLYVAVTRAQTAIELNPSVRECLSALGRSEDFELPKGTAPSAVLEQLLRAPAAPKQNSFFAAGGPHPLDDIASLMDGTPMERTPRRAVLRGPTVPA